MTRVFLTLGLFLIAFESIATAQPATPTINDFSFLAGCWETTLRGNDVSEHWMKPAGGTMFGMGRVVTQGKTIEFEFTQIREDKDGSIYYVAKPSGQAEASFRLVSFKNKEAIFENPQHDFPRRIIYRQQPDGSLFARVEATDKGETRGLDYPYKRAKCE